MTTDLDTSKQIARIIHQHPALDVFPAGSQERIVSTAVLLRVARRGAISIPRDSFALVGFGLLKTAVLVGKFEFITHLAGPGETIGMYESLATTNPEARPNRPTRHSVVTENATVVFVKALAVLAELTNATSRAAHAIALSCGALEHHTLERLITTVYGTSDVRIATMLLDLADRFGDVREDGSSFVPLHFSRAELAALCGVTQETLIRKLSGWAKDGLVMDSESGGIEIRSAEELRTKTGVEVWR